MQIKMEEHAELPAFKHRVSTENLMKYLFDFSKCGRWRCSTSRKLFIKNCGCYLIYFAREMVYQLKYGVYQRGREACFASASAFERLKCLGTWATELYHKLSIWNYLPINLYNKSVFINNLLAFHKLHVIEKQCEMALDRTQWNLFANIQAIIFVSYASTKTKWMMTSKTPFQNIIACTEHVN